MAAFRRPVIKTLEKHLSGPRRFMQVLFGPRQTGKTTLARQIAAGWPGPSHYATADTPLLKDRVWIDQEWENFRLRPAGAERTGKSLLILDEIQKISGWAQSVKSLWDEDSAAGRPIRVLLLGSSPLLDQRSLTESLAGRFEIIPNTHWAFDEMHDAFGWDLDRFIYFGGYPGAAPLIEDETRWSRYILDSIVETTVSRDILLTTRIDKPALFRRLFDLGASYSGQILSYQKMLGQLRDAGNTTTLAHYLSLLHEAGMLAGLPKFSGQTVRQRASSPKLIVMNTALFSAASHLRFDEARADGVFWGRLVESAVGATLANGIAGTDIELFYWRQGNEEVDFVLRRGPRLTAIEVKSGRRPGTPSGMAAFDKIYKPHRKYLVGGQGLSIEEFLQTPIDALVE